MMMETTEFDGNQDIRSRTAVFHLGTEEGSTSQEQAVKEDSILKSLFPLINSMKLFGLYFTVKPRVGPSNKSQSMRQVTGRCRHWNPAHIYALIMLVAIWLNAVQHCLIFSDKDTLGADLFGKLGKLCNHLFSAILQTSYYVASHTGSLDRVFCQVNLSVADLGLKYSRRAKVLTVVCWLLMALQISYFVYLMIANAQVADLPLLYVVKTFHMSRPYLDILKTVVIIQQLLSATPFTFAQAMNYKLSPVYVIDYSQCLAASSSH